MARYGIESKLNPTEAIAAAMAYFGPAGIGLRIQDQGNEGNGKDEYLKCLK